MFWGILGRKEGMTQLFRDDGTVCPVTVIEAGPCTVTQVRTIERDGYRAVQLGFGQAKRLNKPQQGQLKGLPPHRHLREVPVDGEEEVAFGQKVDVAIFQVGDIVDVTGVSKGKGFAGVVKRHHFAGGPKTHGQSDRHRAPGSIGATTTPGRVFKGMRMAGHMGHQRVTAQNLEVVRVDSERNLLLIRGAVPGPTNGLVLVCRAVKKVGRPGKR
ncbi:MAG: 50S ribosomal protein L3 [Chloroflexi bacterium]|nr:50S ribosomal protein L3 [Chloroflexota bacterium]